MKEKVDFCKLLCYYIQVHYEIQVDTKSNTILETILCNNTKGK